MQPVAEVLPNVDQAFLFAQVLNLSFNCLTSNDVEELSNLLRIRELYLSNNWIRSLPPIMDRFSRLETLSLEQNSIVGEEIFPFLSIVPRLRSLNLSHNKITGFPEVRPHTPALHGTQTQHSQMLSSIPCSQR